MWEEDTEPLDWGAGRIYLPITVQCRDVWYSVMKMEVIKSKELRGVMKHFWSTHWPCSSVARKKCDLFTVLKLNQTDPFGWAFVWGFWIQKLLLIKVFSELCQCSPLQCCFLFPPAFFLLCFFLNLQFQLWLQSFCCLTTCRLWSGRQSGRSKCTLRCVVWQWWDWPLRISSLTGLVKTRGKDRISEAGCENCVACFQDLCCCSSEWVFEHPDRVRGMHLKVQRVLKQLK